MDAIAIDGPAASGKTAIGSALAKAIKYRFLDTGAMYRAVTWAAQERGIDPEDESQLVAFVDAAAIDVADAAPGSEAATKVVIDGHDSTPHLREPQVDTTVSLVSRVPRVRARLVEIQRQISSEGRVIMAGRDIGSVVLPDARLKVYLDASREVRARRRAEQMRLAGQQPDFEALLADLERRDRIDSSRDASPLTAAPGAVIIHTDDLSIEEVVRRLVTLARK